MFFSLSHKQELAASCGCFFSNLSAGPCYRVINRTADAEDTQAGVGLPPVCSDILGQVVLIYFTFICLISALHLKRRKTYTQTLKHLAAFENVILVIKVSGTVCLCPDGTIITKKSSNNNSSQQECTE